MASSTNDLDVGSGNRDEGTLPLLVAEASGTLEGNSGSVLELGKVKGGTGRNSDVVQDDRSARSLALDGGSSIGECAARTSVQARRSSRDERASAEEEGCECKGNHDECSLERVTLEMNVRLLCEK